MRELFYRQCRLRQRIPGGVREQVSYIPEPFCSVGKVLRLRSGGAWEDGWEVVSAGARRPFREVEEHARDHGRVRAAGGLG